MRYSCASWCATFGCFFGVLLLMAGCDNPVREDRSVNFSSEGDKVGFQHGEDGVFVADPKTGDVQRIFSPAEDVLASSSPLWSPVDKQLIFSTARKDAPVDQQNRLRQSWDANPAGRVFEKGDVTYTCWLRAEPTEDNPSPQSTQLFDATCDHPGYVATNLAIRWHPNGGSVFHVDRLPNGRHGLFEFDLATQSKRRVGEISGAALIFDWSPDGSYLSCVVLDGEKPNPQVDGIWIFTAKSGQWWQVHGSEILERDKWASLSEALKTTRPTWHDSGDRFAFVTRFPGGKKNDKARSAIFVAETASQEVDRLYESEQPVRGLRWHPQNSCLGVVLGEEQPALHVIDESGAIGPPLTNDPVRRFVGWDPSGRRFAYIIPDKVPTHRDDNWAFWLPPSRMPRDRVVVVDTQSESTASTVLSGMRVTFPKWSPSGDKLSLWCTFSPTHRSLPASLTSIRLLAGDPATILNAESGELTWMAVNPHEKAQIGHYFLLKRDYEQAWQWYEEAAQDRSKSAPNTDPLRQLRQRMSFQQSSEFFEYICLTKLGRHADASRKLEEFHQGFKLSESSDEDQPADVTDIFHVFASQMGMLARDSYIAEVYLSLDLAGDGVDYFEHVLANAQADDERFFHAVLLSQMLLLTEQNDEYARLAVETIAPLLLKLNRPAADDKDTSAMSRRQIYLGVGGICLMPMFSTEFLTTIDRDQLAMCIETARNLSVPNNSDTARLGADLLLHTAYTVLKDNQQRQQAATRVAANSQSKELLGNESVDGMARMVEQFRAIRW